MRICYLGDANSIHTKKLCCFFRDKGYDVSVISLNDGEIDGVKVYSMEMKIENQGNSISKIRYLKNIMKIKKIIRNIKPDILHAHYATSYGLIGALSKYKPYIVSVWGSDVYDFPNKSFIHKALLKYNLKKADIILSTSRAMAKETNKYTDKNILITPFGVDIDMFKPNKANKEKNSDIVIGTVKTLEDNYGIEYLIRAFNIMLKKNKKLNLKLIIAGKGSKEVELRKLCKEFDIEEYVEFLGYIDQKKVPRVFNSFDIAVFPSIFESFGVAAVEAEACGIPVIVSDAEGLMEATSSEYSSLIFKKRDINDLVNKIETLVYDNELREIMGINARKFVEENYNYIDNFNYMNSIYLDLTKKLN
ncbi:MAG: glycosyltransferase [Clostridium sp.]|uniref:glycosyltransferase n=1 Tax=Clostridium sp. TaxID=1506 RepID=UPI0025BD523B|nr:glycosyltransferase [Clostridium sp.]MCF0147273.1 glycosyltransferase [Clostridium sp.]